MTRHYFLKGFIALVFLSTSNFSFSQPWTYDFGTTTGTANNSNSNTGKTDFFPSTPSGGGTYRVRVGSGSGTITLANPGTTLGSGSEAQLIASFSNSTNKFTVSGWAGAPVAYLKAKLRNTSTDNGVLVISLGDGGTPIYNDNLGYTSNYTVQLATLVINYTSGSISSVQRRISGSFSTIASSGISKDVDQTIEIYGNNAASATTYYKAGTHSLNSQSWDLWVDGTKISTSGGFASAGSLAAGTNLSGLGFFGESSASNAARLYIDDLEYSNSLPVNQPPVISSNGGGATAAINFAENTTAVTTVTATDADGTTPTYSLNGGADENKFTINSTTGALTFNTAPDFETPTDVGTNNTYEVIVRATDGSLNDDQTITVTVTDVLVETYYPITSATNLAALNNWTGNSDGSAGTAPLNFSDANQLFNVNKNAAITGTWILAGSDAIISGSAVLTVQPTGRIESSAAGSQFDMATKSVVLKSDATGTAAIGQLSGTLINATNITAERYIGTSKRAWRLLTSPVTGPTIKAAWQESRHIATAAAAASEPTTYGTLIAGGTGFPDDATANAQGYDFIGGTGTPSIRAYTFGNPTGNWNSTLATTSAIDARQAYLLFVRGDRTVTTGAGTTTLRATGTYKASAAVSVPAKVSAAYTLVGNPYPSNIDFESIYTANAGIQHRFWIWDATFGSFGGYKLINYTSGSGTSAVYEAIPQPFTIGAPGPATDLKTIQSGQGFFVEPLSAALTLNITEANKTATAVSTQIFRLANGTAEKLNINVNYLETDNTTAIADGVQAKYDANFSGGFAAEDILKPNNFSENLAIVRSDKYMIVEGRPLVSNADTTYLALWNTTERNYQFQLKAENFSASALNAYLVDRYTNTSTLVSLSGTITNINFTVNADAASKAIDRFMIVYRVSSTLPVDFTTIKASLKNAAIQVEWNVATETNTKAYEVEKSTNGQQFTKASTVAANGNNAYNWLDVTPTAGLNYYRIKGISNNGEVKYSAVARVNIGKGRGSVSVYPNPVSGKSFTLQLSNKDRGNYTLRITNNIGQVVFNKTINHNGGSSSQTIRLTNELSKGVHQLEILGEDGTKETTQIINK